MKSLKKSWKNSQKCCCPDDFEVTYGSFKIHEKSAIYRITHHICFNINWCFRLLMLEVHESFIFCSSSHTSKSPSLRKFRLSLHWVEASLCHSQSCTPQIIIFVNNSFLIWKIEAKIVFEGSLSDLEMINTAPMIASDIQCSHVVTTYS